MNDKKVAYIVFVILFLLNSIVLFYLYQINTKQKHLICDLQTAFTAERFYTWNILRDTLKIDPASQAKGVINPILTDKLYYSDCK